MGGSGTAEIGTLRERAIVRDQGKYLACAISLNRRIAKANYICPLIVDNLAFH